jgi:hypothetical protein
LRADRVYRFAEKIGEALNKEIILGGNTIEFFWDKVIK